MTYKTLNKAVTIVVLAGQFINTHIKTRKEIYFKKTLKIIPQGNRIRIVKPQISRMEFYNKRVKVNGIEQKINKKDQ